MLLADLIEGVAGDSRQPKVVVEAMVRGLLARIAGAVGNGETVNLVGFGRFEVYERSALRGHNLRTGESLKIPATKAVRFKVGQAPAGSRGWIEAQANWEVAVAVDNKLPQRRTAVWPRRAIAGSERLPVQIAELGAGCVKSRPRSGSRRPSQAKNRSTGSAPDKRRHSQRLEHQQVAARLGRIFGQVEIDSNVVSRRQPD